MHNSELEELKQNEIPFFHPRLLEVININRRDGETAFIQVVLCNCFKCRAASRSVSCF